MNRPRTQSSVFSVNSPSCFTLARTVFRICLRKSNPALDFIIASDASCVGSMNIHGESGSRFARCCRLPSTLLTISPVSAINARRNRHCAVTILSANISSIRPTGARHFQHSFRKTWNSSSCSWIRNPRTTTAVDKIPCRTAFIREASFPCKLLGPVDLRAFLRFEANMFGDTVLVAISLVSCVERASRLFVVTSVVGETSLGVVLMTLSILSWVERLNNPPWWVGRLARLPVACREESDRPPTQPPLLQVCDHARTIPLS